MVESNIEYGSSLVKDDLPAKADVGVWSAGERKISRSSQKRTFVPFTIMPSVDCEGPGRLISECFENEDPRTQTAILDREDKQVQELIYRFRGFHSILYYKRLADRLLTLFTYAKEEDPFNIGIAAGSLRNFYIFLQLHTNIKYPSISLTPDNNIYASWRGENNRVFSILFLSNGDDARYVVLKPNDKHPKKQDAISGSVTTDIIIEAVKSYGVLDWISE